MLSTGGARRCLDMETDRSLLDDGRILAAPAEGREVPTPPLNRGLGRYRRRYRIAYEAMKSCDQAVLRLVSVDRLCQEAEWYECP